MKRAILGSIYHTPVLGSFERLENALVVFDTETGLIDRVSTPEQSDYLAQIEHFENISCLEKLKKVNTFYQA